MSLTHPPSKILVAYLIGETLFTDPSDGSAWPLYISRLPDTEDIPDNAAAIFDTAGIEDGRLMAGTLIFHYGFQVMIRTNDYDAGWTKAQAVETKLESVTWAITETIGASTYTLQNISQVGQIISLGSEQESGKDSGTKRRNLFSINYLATLKEA